MADVVAERHITCDSTQRDHDLDGPADLGCGTYCTDGLDALPSDATIFTSDSSTQSIQFPARPGYDYLPSDSIRLLKILPASSSGSAAMIHCRLEPFPLNGIISYTALSYTWGSPPDVHEIVINGHRTPVRKNLWRFLQEVRNLNAQTCDLLWIDALCINQADNEERTQQVALMAQIYTKATRVLIWLGPSYTWSDEAMAELIRRARCGSRRDTCRSISGKRSELISLLCLRKYWTRLWIFQEVALARDILLMCGSCTAPWTSFRDIVLDVDHLREAHQYGTTNVRSMSSMQYRLIRQSPALGVVSSTRHLARDVDLYNLILATQDLSCTNVLDRVYAVLGVATKGCTDIRANYDLPATVVLNAVLRNHHNEVGEPSNLQMVERQCQALADVQGVGIEAVFSIADSHERSRELANDVARHPLALEGSRVSLWWAVHHGHKVVEQMLLTAPGFDLNDKLGQAERDWSSATVKLLLSLKEFSHEAYRLLLLHAAENGDNQVIHILFYSLQYCSAREFGIKAKNAALVYALEGCHVAVIRLLLDEGAGMEWGLTSWYGLMRGVIKKLLKSGHFEVAKLLVERLATDWTTWDILICDIIEEAFTSGHCEFAKLLLERLATIREDLLFVASEQGAHAIMEDILKSAVDLNNRRYDEKGTYKSALYYAVEAGHMAIAEMLLSRGADVDMTAFQWRPGHYTDDKVPLRYDTPLCFASRRGKTEMVQLLLRYGASTSLLGASLYNLSSVFMDAISTASYEGRLDTVMLLLSHGAKTTMDLTQFHATLNEQRPVINTLRDNYWWQGIATPLNKHDIDELLPVPPDCIHLAAQRGYLDIVKVLYEKKPICDGSDDLHQVLITASPHQRKAALSL